MRYYGFGNYYLSSLQQGLQAHHVFAEMVAKYMPCMNTTEKDQLLDWAKNHKTIVLLNGGNSKDLAELYDFFVNEGNLYPCASFSEDEQSLCGALTSVGIILPARIYDTAAMDRQQRGTEWEGRPTAELSVWEEELIARLNQYGLAK